MGMPMFEPKSNTSKKNSYGFCMLKIGNHRNMGSLACYINPDENTITVVHAGIVTIYKGRNITLMNEQLIIDNIPVRDNDSRICQQTNEKQSATNDRQNNKTEQKTSLKRKVFAGVLLGVGLGLPSILVCLLPKKNVAVTIGENERIAFQQFSPFFITTVFPVVEELIFRRYLPRWMNVGFKKIGFSSNTAEYSSMLLSNLFFAAGHKDKHFDHFADGVFLSLLSKYHQGSQVPNSVAHVLSNFFAYLALQPYLTKSSDSSLNRHNSGGLTP